MICIEVITLSCAPCCFAQSMTFLHTVIYLGTMSRDVKCVLYVKLIHVTINFKKEKKTTYLGHRKFLRPNHPYHILHKDFNGEHEFDIAPKALTGRNVYKIQQHINVLFGKKQKKSHGEKYLEKVVEVL